MEPATKRKYSCITWKQTQYICNKIHTCFLGKGQGLIHPAALACSCSEAQMGRNGSPGLVMSSATRSR